MKWSGAIRQQLLIWAVVFGVWALLVFAFAGQLVITAEREWPDALVMSLRDWLPWALLSPMIAWLSARFPLERKRLLVSVPLHVAACVTAVLACYLLLRPGPLDRNPPPGGGPQFRFRGGRGAGPPPGPRARPFDGQPLDQRIPPEERRRLFINGLILFARSHVPIYWIIVSIVHAMAYYRRSEERERTAAELEARLADAKLQALRMQLHPHFLFNTLNAISTLVHKDPGMADEMITNLSELLRATLDTSEQEIPLRRELDFLNRYLEIQQVRFGERLRVHREIDADALDGLVPTLILQPLVENAVRHGIEPETEAGVVQILASRENDRLHLAIRDNGSGPKQFSKERQGIGLANTRTRLKEIYGDAARLVLNTGAEGFSVELDMPFREVSARKAEPTLRA